MSTVPAKSQTNPKPEQSFEQFELDRFESDDGHTGRFLCKMMSTLFFYAFTILCGVIMWTFFVLN